MGNPFGGAGIIRLLPIAEHGHIRAMARSVTIKVLVTPAERDMIRAAAERDSRSVSDYVRLAAMEQTKETKMGKRQ